MDGNNRLPTAPIPAISAPMFITIAGKLNKSIKGGSKNPFF
jgi:hypothetical protein